MKVTIHPIKKEVHLMIKLPIFLLHRNHNIEIILKPFLIRLQLNYNISHHQNILIDSHKLEKVSIKP